MAGCACVYVSAVGVCCQESCVCLCSRTGTQLCYWLNLQMGKWQLHLTA